MSKWIVLVNDGDGFESVSNHLHDGGYFPTRDDAEEYAELVALDYDNAGYEVTTLVMPV